MEVRKDKESTIEIGGYYAIIGKDAREYSVEVLGKRVTDMDTDVYIHYEGTDKRLDEWVDIQRLMPLKTHASNDSSSTLVQGQTEEDQAEKGRLKRKATKDAATMSTEPLKQHPQKRPGEVVQEIVGIQSHGHHGHDHDDEEVPRVRNVEWILYAGFDIATWYYSPFPEEYQDCQRLFICEYCLKYIRQVESFMNHTKNCKRKKPPGTVVYSKGVNKIYKVDGKTNKLYCQNLSLLAKLFLDNKTLYFDVYGFHFFVLTETRAGDRADVPVGFFSKEIVSYDGYNLACILILPPFQRKSYGKLLIEFSYELTKIEGKVGSPEKPLSDLGKLGYVSYWVTAILRELYPKPWPAKRIILPHRRRSRVPSIKSTQHPHITQEGTATTQESASSASQGGQSLPDVKTVSRGRGPMDMDSPTMSGSIAEASHASNDGNVGGDTKEIAFSVRELAARTGIMEEDLLETLVTMGWMTHWQDTKDQLMTPAVKEAKRRYRKLMKFHEQQQLFGKFGGGHDSGHAGQHDGHDSESGQGHHYHSSRQHSRQQFNAHISNDGGPAETAVSLQSMTEQRSLQQQLAQDIDPIAILDIPESDDETGEQEGNNGALSENSHLTGMNLVAVVTMEMVKEYQDRHNVRLDPYLDRSAIDWAAYHSTLDQ
ncbi:K(lysine) acetyltransferase [Mortierella polycephala]|uniref:histone acetyltransferase n=1 Tax=Mortierella polycephala TaxID=41804 RepID=A0A9P6TZY7_9FUNG|nr:K(lysine) acetyltransferase [Mortierella polycephala]